jgi:hypothetical protein
MIANEHFRWPPAIPTLPLGGHTAARPRKAKLHAKNRGGIDRYADRLVCRRGRASGEHLWSPDCRSRVDRFEPALTSIQRRSEMKALWCGATALGLVAAVSLSPAMAQRPKPSGWEHLARHKPARRPQLPECGHDKHALRVAVRIRPLRDMEGSLGPGPGLGN